MPEPISTYGTLKFLWQESQPIRTWLWGKLPFVRDVKQRDAVEYALSRLLDDSNKLAKGFSGDILEAKLNDRFEQFRQELEDLKIAGADADLFIERANVFVHVLIGGPLGDLIALRSRLSSAEESTVAMEHELSHLRGECLAMQDRMSELENKGHRLSLISVSALTAGILATIFAVAELVIHH